MSDSKYFTKRQASEYLSQTLGLPLSEKTLSKYITMGGGGQIFKNLVAELFINNNFWMIGRNLVLVNLMLILAK
ncbi:MAG: hypothetical protein ACI4OR_02455 [Alphaproteobacteria bacterium]